MALLCAVVVWMSVIVYDRPLPYSRGTMMVGDAFFFGEAEFSTETSRSF